VAQQRNPKVPQGLHKAGQGLWKAVLGDLASDWELTVAELHVLERACECADRIDELEAEISSDGLTTEGSRGQTILHPAVAECRQWKLTEAKLLGSLDLAPPTEPSPVQTRASRAATTRWSRERRERARARGAA
jgi:P27 family predicted phage terminase small subunit